MSVPENGVRLQSEWESEIHRTFGLIVHWPTAHPYRPRLTMVNITVFITRVLRSRQNCGHDEYNPAPFVILLLKGGM